MRRSASMQATPTGRASSSAAGSRGSGTVRGSPAAGVAMAPVSQRSPPEAIRPPTIRRVAGFRVMGILNVTPDSFSDGGEWFGLQDAVAHARALVAEGADLVDVGGESTRPGAHGVGEEEELRRVLPVIEALAADLEATLSVDTSKAAVARAALGAGAGFVNDVTALRGDPAMAGVIAEARCECCLMHMLGEPRTMQNDPRYGDVVDDVRAFLEERAAFAVA